MSELKVANLALIQSNPIQYRILYNYSYEEYSRRGVSPWRLVQARRRIPSMLKIQNIVIVRSIAEEGFSLAVSTGPQKNILHAEDTEYCIIMRGISLVVSIQ